MRGSEPGEGVRFGPFEFDSERLELRRSGSPLTLQPQPARALALLLSRPGRLVEREELQAELWGRDPQLDVDRSLNHTIRKLRQALDDDAQRSTYIQTVARRGYRFIAEVSPRCGPGEVSRRRAAAAAADSGRQADPWRGPIRIAVYRFRDVSADRRWPSLSDGVVEELISELVYLREAGLSVLDTGEGDGPAGRSPAMAGPSVPVPSFPGSPVDPGVIADRSPEPAEQTAPKHSTGPGVAVATEERGRDFGIRGCVRRSGRQVRLNVHLVRSRDGTLVGTARLDDELGDLFEVQRRIARQIAEALVLPLLDTAAAIRGEGTPPASAAAGPGEDAEPVRGAVSDGRRKIG